MKAYTEITIYHIAEKLGLSASTISRALKDHFSISQKTIEKVKKTAKEMGYRPNSLAVSLRSKKNKTIGVLVPTISQPFLSSLIISIEITAQKAGYNVVIMQSHDSYKEEVNLAKYLYSSRVSGIICSLAMETRDTSHFQIFKDTNIPLVFVDSVPKNFSTFRVVIDNYTAGYKATKHLIEQGCTRIAHLTVGEEFGNLYNERRKGYRDALKEFNLPIDEDLVVKLNALTYEAGEQGTNTLLRLKNPPDGIFSPTDILAVSAIQCAKKQKIKVPEELAIIGFNNDPISRIIDPSLSTITYPVEKMGKAAVEIILDNLKSPILNEAKEIVFLNTELLVRDSSKRKCTFL